MSNFSSEYFDNVDDLVRAKNDAYAGVVDRRKRLLDVRAFTNMMNTMTDEEADDLGQEEIVNHGLTHSAMLQNETMFKSMVSVTNALVEIIVDTDNPEQDTTIGVRMSEAINRGAIHRKGKFNTFWGKVAGEIVIAGGGPVVMPERYGWLPKLCPDMFFPGDTPLDAEGVTYAFDPKELGVADLRKLRASVKGDSGKYVNLSALDALLKKIEEQIAARSTRLTTDSSTSSSIRQQKNGVEKSVTVPAHWYYEVKYNEDGTDYVSATLFVDTIAGIDVKITDVSDGRSAIVVAHIEKAYASATDWLHFVSVDSEIGGVKTVNTLRGIAEMVYPSGSEMEELLNLTLEGDKIRARPKFNITDAADPDEVKRWDVLRDSYAPKGVEEMKMNSSSGALMTPFTLLQQASAGISTSGLSNGPRGGELRQQSVERQQNNGMLQTNRLVEASNHLDSILETVVWRLLASDAKPKTEGYQEIMWVRKYLEKYKIDYKKLAEREFGRFKHIRVRARRVAGNGDRQQQLETSDWLMSQIQNYEPTIRPLIVHQATLLRTQDPDAADTYVKIPKAIINAQKITAENEYDTIRRRAALGQALPLAQDDVHQDHIPVHLLDMQAHLAAHSIQPWTRIDVIVFAGASEHTGEHIKVLLSNPVTNAEGKVFVQDYQNIVQAAQRVVQEVEESQGNEQAQLTPKEQADVELKAAQLQLEGQKLGIKLEDTQRLWASRSSREALAKRSQYTRELQEAKRLQIESERLKLQQQEKDEPKSKPTSK